MMKKILLSFLVFIGLALAADAQPVLTAATNNPVVGDNYKSQEAISSSIPPLTTSGINQVWDYSRLKDDTGRYSTNDFYFTSPVGLPGATSFPNATLASYYKDDSSYGYWLTNNTTFGWLGIVNKNTGVINNRYDPQEIVLHYPFTYNSIYIDTEHVSYPASSGGSYILYKDTLIGDAYGILKLPNASYNNVLRVKAINNQTNYYYGTINNNSTSTSYWYFTKDFHLPLLVVSYYTFDTTATYFTKTTTTPLAIHNLTAQWQNQLPTLQWTAENTTNTKGFNILRSTDGVNFEKAGVVAVSASSSAYTFIDHLSAANTVYYRIEQVDKNGDLFYSSTVALQPNTSLISYKAFPNPAKSHILLSVPAGTCQAVSIYTLGGKLVYDNPAYQASQQIAIANWAKGLYFVHIKTNGGTQMSSFEKQ